MCICVHVYRHIHIDEHHVLAVAKAGVSATPKTCKTGRLPKQLKPLNPKKSMKKRCALRDGIQDFVMSSP